MFKNKFIAVKTNYLDSDTDCLIHEIETISLDEFNNKAINEKLAFGSSIFNTWNEFVEYDGHYSSYIADYKPTTGNISFFTQKPLSKKDKTTLNQIPIGGVFTFTFIPNLQLPISIKDISLYSISDLEKSYQIKDIKLYKDQKASSIILSLINNNKFKHYLERYLL